ncbi:hypothetical protein C0J52_25953 [Blattella germanica]|nr:hypothetical protein C0J52_25953 [Blattella germanica]
MFLVWGIRLCIVVRKAPSEFNESRFISMAIYNEFLLSVFLNVSMLFLQSPANPDLLYIIFFCHTQLTVTLLLCLIFGSKVRMQEYSKLSEMDVQEEFQRLYTQLEQLKEKNMRLGNRHLAAKITAMQEAAKQNYNDGAYVEELPSTEPAATNNNRDENLKLNNVLAVVTDKIVCATVSNDDVNAIGLMPLDTTNMTKSPPKSKCSSLVSSPDSDTPLRGTEHVSPVLNRTKVSNLSKSLSESETGGTVNSKEPLPTSGVKLVDLEMSSTCKKSTVGDSASHSRSKKRSNAGKSRNSGGKKHNVDGNTHSKYSDVTSDKQVESGQVKVDGYGEGVSSKPSHSQSSSEGASPNMGSNNRNLKSGHARTHAIVINLDDKNRFTEEVTV